MKLPDNDKTLPGALLDVAIVLIRALYRIAKKKKEGK